MKASKFFGSALCLVLGAACLQGCRSAPYRKGTSAAESMRAAAEDTQNESRALQNALAALTEMETNPPTYLVQQYANYDRSVDRLFAAVARTDDAIKKVEEKNARYMEAWNQQLDTMNYEVVRDHSQSRMSSISNRVNEIVTNYKQTREVVLPMLAYLDDLRKALGADLTPDGLAAFRKIVNNADVNGQKVQQALDRLADSLSNSGERMLPVMASASPGS